MMSARTRSPELSRNGTQFRPPFSRVASSVVVAPSIG